MPEQHLHRFAQEQADTCAIASARAVIWAKSHGQISEAELTERATELHAYHHASDTDGGTYINAKGYGDLLREHGIATKVIHNTDVDALLEPTADRPAVGPDSPVIMAVRGYGNERETNHVVVVDGVHTQSNGQVVLRMNDPQPAPNNPTGTTTWIEKEKLARRAAGGDSRIVLPASPTGT